MVYIKIQEQWLPCERDFQTYRFYPGFGNNYWQIECPRLSQACPDMFCPFNCAGRGTCVYRQGQKLPSCECFDPDDTSAGCTNSMVPESPTQSPTEAPEPPPPRIPNCRDCSGPIQGPCQRSSDKVCFPLPDPSKLSCPLGTQLCAPRKKIKLPDEDDDYRFYDSNTGRGNLHRLRRNLRTTS